MPIATNDGVSKASIGIKLALTGRDGRRVAFAGGRLESGARQDLDAPAGVADHLLLLQMPGRDGNGTATHAQHVEQEQVGQDQALAPARPSIINIQRARRAATS